MSGTFSVKNFEKFQHYGNRRSPPWIKLYNSLLDDYEFARLPDASKAHLLAIWLLASRYQNAIPFDAEWIGRHINATEVVDLSALAASGFIVPDEACSKALAERYQDASKVLDQSKSKNREETEKRRTNPARARAKNDPEFEDTFWFAYPNQVGKPKARASFAVARKAYSLDVIMAGLERYKQAKPPDRQWMNPATFLNQERFNDQPAVVKPSGKPDPTVYTPKPASPTEDSLDALIVEGFEGLHGEDLAEFKREMKATQKRAN